jgi:hypothetical protein
MRYLVKTSETKEVIRTYVVEAEDEADAEAVFTSGAFLDVYEDDGSKEHASVTVLGILRG